MLQIQKMITQKKCYIGRNNPKYIVVHETDNDSKGAGARTHARAMSNGNLAGTVHYYVDDGEIFQTLSHDDGAYAVGVSYGASNNPDCTNYNSINIEICVNPDSDYVTARKNCIDLVRYLIGSTGIPASKVIRHYDAKAKYCPRKMMDSPALWTDFKNQIQSKPSSAGQWIKSGDKWWYKHADGSYTVAAWEMIEGKRYYFDGSGWMCTGWIKDGNTWYYCNDSGAMATNTWIEGLYYVGGNGAMLTSTTTPDGYYVDGSGKWDGKPKQTSGDNWVWSLQGVLNLQYHAGLAEDGIAGRKTLAACPTLKSGAKGNITKLVQQRLGEHFKIGISGGYDGQFGRGTEAAVMELQRVAGIGINGVVGPDTWIVLLEM